MKTISEKRIYNASAINLFDCLDDLSVTGMHMTKSSMPMMGGKMDLQFLSPNHAGPDTKYRWRGKVLWMPLDFTVMVISWIRGKAKSWQTVGEAKLIIMSWFRMDLSLEEMQQQTMAHLSISYEKPKGVFNRFLSFLLADWYCKWCLKNMLDDAGKRLNRQQPFITQI